MNKMQAILENNTLPISFMISKTLFDSESFKGWISVWQKLSHELFTAFWSSGRDLGNFPPVYWLTSTAQIFSTILRWRILANHGKTYILFAMNLVLIQWWCK